MEIERKYLITNPPQHYQTYPFHQIEQGYLNTEPVVRVRRSDQEYYLTYKSKGLLVREEYNLPLTREAYDHLIQKADGNILTKKRYLLPLMEFAPAQTFNGAEKLTIELDIFEGKFSGLILAEVEFTSKDQAKAFLPPAWFQQDVTFSGEYQNSRLSSL